jgi:hypothetical protein
MFAFKCNLCRYTTAARDMGPNELSKMGLYTFKCS